MTTAHRWWKANRSQNEGACVELSDTLGTAAAHRPSCRAWDIAATVAAYLILEDQRRVDLLQVTSQQ
jgi:hypothetical protein